MKIYFTSIKNKLLPSFRTNFTEHKFHDSQNHRMVEAIRYSEVCLVQPSCLKVGSATVDCSEQRPAEYWIFPRLHCFSWQPVLMCSHPHSGKSSRVPFPISQFVPAACWSCYRHHWEEYGSTFFSPLHHIFMHIGKILHKDPYFLEANQSQLS